MQERLEHGREPKETKWWLVSIRPQPHSLLEFLSPAFLPEQAIARLLSALEEVQRRRPNSKTRGLVQALQEGKATAVPLDSACCYSVSYFNDSRSYVISEWLEKRIEAWRRVYEEEALPQPEGESEEEEDDRE